VAVRTAAAALCLAAAVPVGTSLRGAGAGAGDVVVVGGSRPTSTEAASSAGTGSSSETPTRLGGTVTESLKLVSTTTGGLLPRSGIDEVLVPDDALLVAEDLGIAPVTLDRDDSGAADAVATVAEVCAGPVPGDDRAAGGRTLIWSGPAVGSERWRFGTAVRVFSGGGAGDQLAYLRRAVGVCAGSEGMSREPVAGLPGDEALLAADLVGEPGQPERVAQAFGLIRVGRVTVGVQVSVPGAVGTDEDARRALAAERARTLLVQAHERVAGFARLAAADTSLG
jgi:hypothetical protein